MDIQCQWIAICVSLGTQAFPHKLQMCMHVAWQGVLEVA